MKRRRRNLIFVSYSHKDDKWLEELQEHLKPLEREGIVTHWSDTLIKVGGYWKREIEDAIESAKVAVLLVSKHFLASDFIAESELPYLLAAAKNEGASIMPVLLSPCRFTRTKELACYQAVNSPDRTLAEMTEAERDRVWLKLTYAIEDILESERVAAEEISNPVSVETARSPLPTPSRNPAGAAMSSGVQTIGQREDSHVPDLTLLIQAQEDSGENSLTYQLRAKNRNLGISDKMFGPVHLKVDPRNYFDDFFSDIESCTYSEGEVMQSQLEAKGAFLFMHLFPAELQETIQSLVGRVGTLQIQSNEAWIPWEMLRFHDHRSNGEIYLCEAFALTRWLAGIASTTSFPLSSIAVAIPDYQSLPLANVEREYLQNLASDDRNVVVIDPRYVYIQEALASGLYDGFHFGAHGIFDSQAPDRSCLLLEGGESFKPEDLSGRAKDLGLCRPLVFMNACQTGRSAHSLTNIGGWAAQFLRAGAGAFIGSYWSLNLESAVRFTRSFYREFLGGLPLGEAVRRSRLDIRRSGDPTWLAYTVFANPLAIVPVEATEDDIRRPEPGAR